MTITLLTQNVDILTVCKLWSQTCVSIHSPLYHHVIWSKFLSLSKPHFSSEDWVVMHHHRMWGCSEVSYIKASRKCFGTGSVHWVSWCPSSVLSWLPSQSSSSLSYAVLVSLPTLTLTTMASERIRPSFIWVSGSKAVPVKRFVNEHMDVSFLSEIPSLQGD